jgi:hypothetical protein
MCLYVSTAGLVKHLEHDQGTHTYTLSALTESVSKILREIPLD